MKKSVIQEDKAKSRFFKINTYLCNLKHNIQ
jgi:hypothetical protein